jgi:hypothetical protein
MQAILLNISVLDDKIIATVVYTDGVSFKTVEPMRVDQLTLNAFKGAVQARLDQLAATAFWWQTLPVGPIDTTVKP